MADSGFDADDFGDGSPKLTVGVPPSPPPRTPPTPSPVPPPGTRKPPLSVKAKLTPEQKTKIEEKGIAGKGRKTKKRKSKSRRRRNGRTYRRS